VLIVGQDGWHWKSLTFNERIKNTSGDEIRALELLSYMAVDGALFSLVKRSWG